MGAKPINKKMQPRLRLDETASLVGVPETIRTSGPFLRREVLCPAELREHNDENYIKNPVNNQAKTRKREGQVTKV